MSRVADCFEHTPSPLHRFARCKCFFSRMLLKPFDRIDWKSKFSLFLGVLALTACVPPLLRNGTAQTDLDPDGWANCWPGLSGQGKTTQRDAGQDEAGSLWDRIRRGFGFPPVIRPGVITAIDNLVERRRTLNYVFEQAIPYLYFIVEEIEKRGLPMELVFIPAIESSYQGSATGPGGTAGMWQFTHGTGQTLGLRNNRWLDERRDVLSSTEAALNYLQNLGEQFNGDWELAVAAYNAGPLVVRNAMDRNRRQGKPTDFWSLSLPSHTRQYIPHLYAYAAVVSDPKSFDITLQEIPNLPLCTRVEFDRPVSLHQVSQASGASINILKKLNPALKQGHTAPNGPHRLLVPASLAPDLASSLKEEEPAFTLAESSEPRLNPPQPTPTLGASVQMYSVQPGDSLSRIAARHRVRVADIQRLNGISATRRLKRGSVLKIPQHGGHTPDASVKSTRIVRKKSVTIHSASKPSVHSIRSSAKSKPAKTAKPSKPSKPAKATVSGKKNPKPGGQPRPVGARR
ncbi:membrane-bound lytic murein transglycosylase D [Gammaproteobacteria bacterium]